MKLTEAIFGEYFYKYLLSEKKSVDFPNFSASYLEVPGPIGVADILTLNLPNSARRLSAIAKRLEGVPKASAAYIISELSKVESRNVEELVSKDRRSRKTVVSTLRLLTDAKITIVEGSRVRLAKRFRPPEGTFCFYELKLRNWQRAMYQSAQALAYSDYAYCVLPSEMSEVLKKQKEPFRASGIGLATFDITTSRCTLLVKARRKGPKRLSAKMEMLLRFSERPRQSGSMDAVIGKVGFFQKLRAALLSILAILRISR